METELKDFIDDLLLDYEGLYKDNGDYVITLNDSNEFSNVYNQISLNKQLQLGDLSTSTVDRAVFIFYNTWFEITLAANFNSDVYTITINKR